MRRLTAVRRIPVRQSVRRRRLRHQRPLRSALSPRHLQMSSRIQRRSVHSLQLAVQLPRQPHFEWRQLEQQRLQRFPADLPQHLLLEQQQLPEQQLLQWQRGRRSIFQPPNFVIGSLLQLRLRIQRRVHHPQLPPGLYLPIRIRGRSIHRMPTCRVSRKR